MSEARININGEIKPASRSGLSIHNRGYKYGDALFESVRIANGKVMFAEDHYSRLVRGMKILQFEVPNLWDLAFFKKELLKVVKENDVAGGGRIRVTVFRRGEGLYTPSSNEIGFVMEAGSLEESNYVLNEKGLKLGRFDKLTLSSSIISQLKTNNCLPYILAALDAREKGFDDVLLFNEKGMISEATSSNVFLHINGMLYTPALGEACVAGVMRKKIIQLAKKANLPVIETAVSPDLLNDADEVFLTNAISGIRWIGAYEKKRYFHKLSEKLVKLLNERM